MDTQKFITINTEKLDEIIILALNKKGACSHHGYISKVIKEALIENDCTQNNLELFNEWQQIVSQQFSKNNYNKQAPLVYDRKLRGLDVRDIRKEIIINPDFRRIFLVKYFIEKHEILADWEHCKKNIEIESKWKIEYPTLLYLSKEDIDNYNRNKQSETFIK